MWSFGFRTCVEHKVERLPLQLFALGHKTGRDSFRPDAGGYVGGCGGVESGADVIIATLAAVGYICAGPHASIGGQGGIDGIVLGLDAAESNQ